MKVVVGLGNPGAKYQGTRHNIGFDVLGELSRRFQAGSSQGGHESLISEAVVQGEKVLLVAPQTFMNLSGRAVASLARFYKLSEEQILVVCDDINLPLGQLRLRANGSSGGQKGLADIILKLGSENVPRLRFGVGRPRGRMDVSDYVLKPFLAEEREEVAHAVQLAADGVEVWVKQGCLAAMNQVNVKNEKPSA